MLGVAPAGCLGVQERFGALPKGQPGRLLGLLVPDPLMPLLERIDAVEQLPAMLLRPVAGFGQRHQIDRPEPHAMRPALAHVAEQPGLGAGRTDLEIEVLTGPVGAGPGERSDLLDGEVAHSEVPRSAGPVPCEPACVTSQLTKWRRLREDLSGYDQTPLEGKP